MEWGLYCSCIWFLWYFIRLGIAINMYRYIYHWPFLDSDRSSLHFSITLFLVHAQYNKRMCTPLKCAINTLYIFNICFAMNGFSLISVCPVIKCELCVCLLKPAFVCPNNCCSSLRLNRNDSIIKWIMISIKTVLSIKYAHNDVTCIYKYIYICYKNSKTSILKMSYVEKVSLNKSSINESSLLMICSVIKIFSDVTEILLLVLQKKKL